MFYHLHSSIALNQWNYEKNFTHIRRNVVIDNRLEASCAGKTDLHHEIVVDNLQKSGVMVNTEIITNLALYEPRTFQVVLIGRFIGIS